MILRRLSSWLSNAFLSPWQHLPLLVDEITVTTCIVAAPLVTADITAPIVGAALCPNGSHQRRPIDIWTQAVARREI